MGTRCANQGVGTLFQCNLGLWWRAELEEGRDLRLHRSTQPWRWQHELVGWPREQKHHGPRPGDRKKCESQETGSSQGSAAQLSEPWFLQPSNGLSVALLLPIVYD